jgi:hypothetical protein
MRAALLLLLVACSHAEPDPPKPPVKLTDAQKATVRESITSAQTRIANAEARRNAAFDHAAQTTRTTAPCSVSRSDLGIAPDITHNGLASTLLRMTRVITPDAKKPASGVASQTLDTDLYSINKKLDGELEYGESAEGFLAATKSTLDARKPAPYELALVMAQFVDPKQLDADKFRGGFTTGALYLWSESAGKIICAADVAGESSSEVTIHSDRDATKEQNQTLASAHLTGELIVRTIDDGINALQAVGP